MNTDPLEAMPAETHQQGARPMPTTLAPVIPTPGELAAIGGIFLLEMSAAQVRDLGMVSPVFTGVAAILGASR